MRLVIANPAPAEPPADTCAAPCAGARRAWLLPAALLLLGLAACGGGGGESDAGRGATNPPPPVPPVAVAPYLRTVHVDIGSASADDNGPGSRERPLRTLSAAMRNLRPGDDVVVAAGTYRESIEVPALAWGSAATRIRAAVPRTVFVKGSVEVDGWVAQGGGVYAVPWAAEQPQQVFRAGQPLRQVGGTIFDGYPERPDHELQLVSQVEGEVWTGRISGDLRSLPENSFFHDRTGRRLLVRLSTPPAAAERLEVSQRVHVLQAEAAAGLSVEGLDFLHANTTVLYRQGAVKLIGERNRLADLVVSDMDGACVQMAGSESTLADSTIERCGQLGVIARGTRMAFTGNRIRLNNTRGFNTSWEAGGMKLIGPGGLQDSTLRDNVVVHNAGDGIWIDFKAGNNLVEGNTTAYNSGFGIHYEASRGGAIRNNISYANGLRGIYLLESSDSLVEGNAVFANVAEGIAIVDGRRSGADPTLRPVNNRVQRNTMAWNDFRRNWVQLTLPGRGYGSGSDRNRYKTDILRPRMSMGFVGPQNPAFERLSDWRAASGLDGASDEQTLGMPAALAEAIAARRILTRGELPVYLANPGVE